jgi:hypothetical protein
MLERDPEFEKSLLNKAFLAANFRTAWYFSGQSVIISYQHCILKLEIFHMDNQRIM